MEDKKKVSKRKKAEIPSFIWMIGLVVIAVMLLLFIFNYSKKNSESLVNSQKTFQKQIVSKLVNEEGTLFVILKNYPQLTFNLQNSNVISITDFLNNPSIASQYNTVVFVGPVTDQNSFKLENVIQNYLDGKKLIFISSFDENPSTIFYSDITGIKYFKNIFTVNYNTNSDDVKKILIQEPIRFYNSIKVKYTGDLPTLVYSFSDGNSVLEVDSAPFVENAIISSNSRYFISDIYLPEQDSDTIDTDATIRYTTISIRGNPVMVVKPQAGSDTVHLSCYKVGSYYVGWKKGSKGDTIDCGDTSVTLDDVNNDYITVEVDGVKYTADFNLFTDLNLNAGGTIYFYAPLVLNGNIYPIIGYNNGGTYEFLSDWNRDSLNYKLFKTGIIKTGTELDFDYLPFKLIFSGDSGGITVSTGEDKYVIPGFHTSAYQSSQVFFVLADLLNNENGQQLLTNVIEE
jgi:competence protein ComGC